MNAIAAALIAAGSITAVLGTIACKQPTPFPQANLPTSPSSGGGSPVDTATVTGSVWLHDKSAVTPYAGAKLWGWVKTERFGSVTGPVSVGADGRYSFTVPTGAVLYLRVSADYQPCVAAIAATGITDHDLHIIADPAQLGAHLPGDLLLETPTLSGTVFETTALGRQVVPGVRVEVDLLGIGDVYATTLTDADGRYILCGLGGFAVTYVSVSKTGYSPVDLGTVQLNGNTIRDIELQR
jgi:hypothetical protein